MPIVMFNMIAEWFILNFPTGKATFSKLSDIIGSNFYISNPTVFILNFAIFIRDGKFEVVYYDQHL